MFHVLVAEDELWIRSAIVEMVENMGAGFKVIGEATDGEEAWELIRQLWPAILITDIMMPKMDGLWLIRQIWEHHLPIVPIILSGYDKFEYARQAIRYGVSEYLLKPVTDTDLKEALNRSLQRMDNFREMHDYILKIQQFIDDMPGRCRQGMGDALESLLNAILRVKDGSRLNRKALLHILEAKLSEMLKNICPEYRETSFDENDSDEVRIHFQRQTENWLRSYKQYSGMDLKWVIQKACDYIDKHHMDDISIAELAKLSNFSISHFSALFKQQTKDSFVNYLNKIRVEKAKLFLIKDDIKIYEVSERVGYISLPYFNRVFKNYTGMSPNEFRKSLGL